jgi:hypothetical protein
MQCCLRQFSSETRSTSAYQPSAPGTDHGTSISGTFTDVTPQTRRPDRPVPPVAGTAAIGAVVQLLGAAIEVGQDQSSMSGILTDAAYRLLLA